VVDIETTGLSKSRHKITEIAACQVKDGKIINEFQTLVNPECRIPSFITHLTGINNEMVKDSPTISNVIPKFLNFLGDQVLVAHNATFDYSFLSHNAMLIGHKLENERLCTRKLANRILHELPSKKLGVICEHYGIINKQAHRAMADVYATVEVLNKFLTHLNERDITTTRKILKFQDLPRNKCY